MYLIFVKTLEEVLTSLTRRRKDVDFTTVKDPGVRFSDLHFTNETRVCVVGHSLTSQDTYS